LKRNRQLRKRNRLQKKRYSSHYNSTVHCSKFQEAAAEEEGEEEAEEEEEEEEEVG
jgi:hypothetical protein